MLKVLKNPGIYMIKCIPNDKIYIGKSKNVFDRLIHHRSYLRSNRHSNNYLQNSYNKYGEDNFVFDIIEYCKYEELSVKESFYINTFESYIREKGFNISLLDENGNIVRAKETLEKLSKSLKGRIISEEWKRKISIFMKSEKGKLNTLKAQAAAKKVKRSKESIEKVAAFHRGRKRSKETCDNISKSLSSKIYQYSINGELIKVWDRISDIVKELDCKSSAIYKSINHKNLVSNGFIWEDEKTIKSENFTPRKVKYVEKIIPNLETNCVKCGNLIKFKNIYTYRCFLYTRKGISTCKKCVLEYANETRLNKNKL